MRDNEAQADGYGVRMSDIEEMGDSVLTKGMLRKALELEYEMRPPSCEPCMALHPSLWEDFKKTFNLTEKQMGRWFVKSTYIEAKDGS